MSKYIRNGADIIAIITNDGWWGNTPGYRQHENYARLRAIEARKQVVRSANTGISCFIDPAGRSDRPQPWDTTAVIRHVVPPTTTPDLLYPLRRYPFPNSDHLIDHADPARAHPHHYTQNTPERQNGSLQTTKTPRTTESPQTK